MAFLNLHAMGLHRADIEMYVIIFGSDKIAVGRWCEKWVLPAAHADGCPVAWNWRASEEMNRKKWVQTRTGRMTCLGPVFVCHAQRR